MISLCFLARLLYSQGMPLQCLWDTDTTISPVQMGRVRTMKRLFGYVTTHYFSTLASLTPSTLGTQGELTDRNTYKAKPFRCTRWRSVFSYMPLKSAGSKIWHSAYPANSLQRPFMFALLMSIFVWTKLTIHAWFCFWTSPLMHVTGPRAMYCRGF